MRIVLDCNVLISAAWNDGPARRAFMQCVRSHTPVLNSDIVAQYRDVMSRRKFRHLKETMAFLYEVLLDVAEFVEIMPCPYKLPDPKDKPYLSAALLGNAGILVTGNIKDFPEGWYDRVQVMPVREFLEHE